MADFDFSNGPVDLDSLTHPPEDIPAQVRRRPAGTSVDIVPAGDVNNGLLDCSFHISVLLAVAPHVVRTLLDCLPGREPSIYQLSDKGHMHLTRFS